MGNKVVEKAMRYIKKPIPVEAIQWTGDNFKEVREFMDDTHVVITMYDDLIIPTLEGDMKAPKDSWIIRGAMGEYYPCRREVFEETYEPICD